MTSTRRYEIVGLAAWPALPLTTGDADNRWIAQRAAELESMDTSMKRCYGSAR